MQDQELAIKIRIYDRQYPMKISSHEEAQVRKAASILNEWIEKYRKQFASLDSQDLLAMVAFDALVTHLKGEEQADKLQVSINRQLDLLIEKISSNLAENQET